MKFDLKKFLILNFPYALMFWFFNRVGEGYRLAAGSDMVAKGMGAISGLGEIISRNPLPSFHPQDLLVGLIGAACIRAAVYIKAKNAKKYRHGVEYGSARWGNSQDIAPFINPKFDQNILLTQTERIMVGRNKIPKYNINNEWYVRDCSRKQKAQYQVRGRSGKPVTNTIPYGFKKDPEEKHHWLVDEEAADVVRRIFRLSVEGKGPLTIAKILMNDKVERPSYYLAQRGRGTCQSKTDMSRPYDWTSNTVADMLAKPEYMGHTVNFRAYKPSYKDKKMIKRPPEEWLIFLL